MLKISSIARDPAKDYGENIHEVATTEHETIELNNETDEQQYNLSQQGPSSPRVDHLLSGINSKVADF